MSETQIKTFEVRDENVSIRFSCKNYGRHLRAAIGNLCLPERGGKEENVQARFASENENVKFLFDGIEHEGQNFMEQAVFFENTEYPLRVKALPNSSNVKIESLYIAGHHSDAASDSDDDEDGAMIYGMLNFHNQVGRTDITVYYTKGEKPKTLTFRTEVLSYKMDYRSDLQTIIHDIEEEYSMLSYSFLKQTYLSFKQKRGESTDLLWWQVFQQEYEKIISACKIIINSPKRRLKSQVRHERAERLRFIAPVLEQEYGEFQEDPHHLYRTEEMILSKDTVENRFLKYVMKEILRRFSVVKEHIKNTLKVSEKNIAAKLDEKTDELQRMVRHPFFKQIGQFKGFSQDSLVMKRARGYSDIYRSWLILQSGFELEDDIHRLEVKDISELYEIWCFIKVKNMVADILGEGAIAKSSGKELTAGFVRQLVYGTESEVTFSDSNGVELATVMYNAQVEEDESNMTSAIEHTSTFTTVQRPDIVLRLSKRSNDDIEYTYLFDAKYRLSDNRVSGYPNQDVPPVDAINQMHRYRDAIYYDALDNEGIKREIVGGYVLYPGNMSADDVRNSYYHQSHNKIGIGAFPLKPGAKYIDEDGNLVLDPSCSEAVLKEQIEEWLLESDRRQQLLQKSVPQRGLEYTDEEELAGRNKWKRTKVLLFVDPYDSHWERIENDEFDSIALGLNFSRFSLRTVKTYSLTKYVAVVSSNKPTEKKMRLYKVEGTPDIIEANGADLTTCLTRNFFESEENDKEVQAYLQYKIVPIYTPRLDAEKIHSMTHGSHNPRVMSMSELMKD